MTREDRDHLEYLLIIATRKAQDAEDALADIRQWLDTIPLPTADPELHQLAAEVERLQEGGHSQEAAQLAQTYPPVPLEEG